MINFSHVPEHTILKKWVLPTANAKLLRKTASQLNDNHYLCGGHFESKWFTNKNGNRLHRNAVPTIFKCESLSDALMREAPWFLDPDEPPELSFTKNWTPENFVFTATVSSPQPSTSTNPIHQTPPHTIKSPRNRIIHISPTQPTMSIVIQKSPGLTLTGNVPPGLISSSPEKRKQILEEELLDIQELAPDEKL